MRQIALFLNLDERQQCHFLMVSPDLCAVAQVLPQPSHPVCCFPPRCAASPPRAPTPQPLSSNSSMCGARTPGQTPPLMRTRSWRRTAATHRILFPSEISVLVLPGISPSWPNKKPTSRSATSSATSLRSSWPRTRPRRPSPWWWTWPSPSPPRRILPPQKRRRSWVSMMPSSPSHRRAIWSSQVGAKIHSFKKGSATGVGMNYTQ